jgi:ubiquinone/menaquinone biosynthesis C-methylase UbiE
MDFASGYQHFMGRWSERLAEPVLDFCCVGEGEIVLDVGCGLGSLASAILSRTARTRFVGIDRSYEAVTAARVRNANCLGVFHVGDAGRMPYGDNTFDHCISLLMPNFPPDCLEAAAEMVRVTRIGGIVGAAAWDFADGLPAHRMFYDIVLDIDPEAGFLRPLQEEGELAALWKENGLTSVKEVALTISMEFRDFADYWAGYAWATEDYLQCLSESASMRLTERLRAAYLAGTIDGPRAFTATALAVRGAGNLRNVGLTAFFGCLRRCGIARSDGHKASMMAATG